MPRRNTATMVLLPTLLFFAQLLTSHFVQAVENTSGTPVSKTTINTTGSGQPLYQHGERVKPFTEPKHAAKYLEEIEQHVEKHVGKIKTVLHEELSDLVHVDVLLIPATAQRPYQLLVTSGVSELAMAVPEGAETHSRVELMIALPKDWPISAAAFSNENYYWPIRWLKKIGRLPHEHDTWIGWGHTIPNGNPIQPIANTKFTGVLLMPSFLLPEALYKLQTKDGEVIRFYGLIPLYSSELELKLNSSLEALEEKLEQHQIDIVLDPNRKNTVP